MKAIRGKYQKGKITLLEPAPEDGEGPVDVLVVFPEAADDPWKAILDDASPRPALSALADESLRRFREGKTAPLDLDKL